MVYKSGISYSNLTDLKELEASLRNSFSKIRQDMETLHQNMQFVQSHLNQVQKDANDSKKDYVTIDKLNALKIKYADINEELKRINHVEDALKKAADRSVDRQGFEIDRKNLVDALNDIRVRIDTIERSAKSAVTDAKLKQLSKEFSVQINDMKNLLNIFDEKGGKIIGNLSDNIKEDLKNKGEEIDKKTEENSKRLKEDISEVSSKLKEDIKNYVELNKKENTRKMLKLLEGINTVREENRKYISKTQVNEVLRRINEEFDSLKERMLDIDMLKKDIKNVRRDKVNKDMYEGQISYLKKSVEDMHQSVNALNENLKDSKKMQKELVSLRAKMAAMKGKQPKRFSILTVANISIVLAFLLLGASFGMYFYQKTQYMNYVIIAAVAFFVIGILIRIISVIRN